MKPCIQEEKAKKKILTSLEKNFMYTWRTKIIYMQSRSPPSTPTPLTFLMVHPLVINIMYTWRTQKIYVQSRSPLSTPSTPTPSHFSNGPSLSHCRNYPTNGLNQTDKASPFPTTETLWGMGTSFRRNGLWDRLGGQGLVTIGHGSQGNH